MKQQHTITHYSTIQIALHWAVAAMVFFQLLFGESMTHVVDAGEEGVVASQTDTLISIAHLWIGISILVLVAIRVGLRLVRGVPKPTEETSAIMAFAGRSAHFLFYVLLVAVPVTGLLTFYGVADLGEIHALAKPAFIVLIVVHALAAMFHHFVLKDGTLGRMVALRSRKPVL